MNTRGARYFTGEPCKHGHVCERYVSDGRCVECVRSYRQKPEVKAKKCIYKQTPKAKAVERAYNQTSKAKAARRTYSMVKNYGVTPLEYETRLKAQDLVCAICHGDNGGRSLSVDHNHKTGRVRGLLCNPCNIALGLLKENRELLGAPFVRYLDQWEG